ncbi:MAG: Pycsar system effector family protein, partial [Gemmatimonadota bacterium]
KPRSAESRSFRAVDTLLRIGVNAQLDLSRSADNKAQVMLTICAGVTTYSLGRAFVEETRYPALTLVVFSLIAALCAVMSMRPPAPRRKPPRPGERGFNILTFTHFASLSGDEYRAALRNLSVDPNAVHDQIADAVWAYGAIFLKRQYYYLEWCYRAFLTGLILSGAVWAWVMW